MNILIVDDHPLFRRGLRDALHEAMPAWTFHEADSAEALMACLQKQQIDLLILDITLPDRNGLDCLQDLKQMKQPPPALMVSMHAESQYALQCFKLGAAGYLTKERAGAELVDAVRRIAAGKRYISAAMMDKLIKVAAGELAGEPHETLSQREFHVLRLLAQGRSLTEIAAELSLSVNSVSTYRARLLEKMGMNNNAALIRYCIEHGILE